MDDPTRDGRSSDYYPEREDGDSCTPTGMNDNCWVHRNSGIANLFFYLLSQGGSHPRQKTTVLVLGIGIEKAQQIWYRALTAYMVPDSTFADARSATARAAADLYAGSCSPEWIAVQKGWDAVGVPGVWSCGCSASISSSAQAFDAAGGSTTVAVTAGEGCDWSATSAADFITVTVGASGTGNGSVTLSVAPNSGTASRTGTVVIAGHTFTATQAAATACGISISPASQSFAAIGGTGTIAVAGSVWCGWTATTSDAFITLTAGASGSGNGTVSFAVTANLGDASRTGTIAIGGQPFTVMQTGACASCTAKDFNGDSRPDIVWRNYLTGSNVVSFMSNTDLLGWTSLPSQYSAHFVLSGVADFNNDRKFRDYLTGANTIWYFSGTTRIGSASLPSVLDTSSSIDAIADFNSDGRPDLLVRNYSTGGNSVLFMDGTRQIGVEALPAVTDTSWGIGGIGDFNGDGQPDVVWRHSFTGNNALWYMNRTQVIGRAALAAVADTSWVIEGVAQ